MELLQPLLSDDFAMQYDVFISYGSADRELASALAERLEGTGRTVWWDRNLVPGQSFQRGIEAALDASRCVVVLWSRHSVNSDWVHAEALDGLDRKILVPVNVDGTRAPLAFRALNAINLTGWPDAYEHDEVERLLERVSMLVEGKIGASQGTRSVLAVEPALDVAPAASDKPSIAVMPIMTHSGDPEDEMLSAGITSEVINSLSRLPGFFVIAFSTMWNYRDNRAGAQQIAQELGVRYLVQGTMMRMGSNVQLMVELVNGTSSRQIWSDNFRSTVAVEDLFKMQEQIATSVAGRLQPRLLGAETERSMSRAPETLQAWELVNRARQPFVSRDQTTSAHALLRRAIALDPNYGEAHAMLALLTSFTVTVRGPQFADEAVAAMVKALEVDPENDLTLMASGACCINLTRYEDAIDYCRRAVEHNPNFADAWSYYGLATLCAERDGAKAIERLKRAFELSPADENIYMWYHKMGPCYCEIGDYDNAVEVTAKSLQHYKGWWFSWLCHAHYLAQVGEADRAREAWQEATDRYPHLTLDTYRASVRHFAPISEHRKDELIEAMEGLGIQ